MLTMRFNKKNIFSLLRLARHVVGVCKSKLFASILTEIWNTLIKNIIQKLNTF